MFFNSFISFQKKGFTLAEILITLGIIGVVSALTLPVIINNTRQKELLTALKKNYSVLQQALISMSEENGDIILPDTFSGQEFGNNLKNYLNYIQYCAADGCISTGETSNYYKKYNKKPTNTNLFDDGQIILNDGSLILIEHATAAPNTLYISVDVNGYNKGPNIWGEDLFTFQLITNGKLLPMGADGTSFTSTSIYCSRTSDNPYNGIACTYKTLAGS